MFDATFSQVTHTQAVVFGKMKDESLSISTLASNNCLCHKNVFQNGVSAFSKTANHFLPKSSKFCIFRIIQFFFQILPVCVPSAYQIMYEKFVDFQCRDQ